VRIKSTVECSYDVVSVRWAIIWYKEKGWVSNVIEKFVDQVIFYNVLEFMCFEFVSQILRGCYLRVLNL